VVVGIVVVVVGMVVVVVVVVVGELKQPIQKAHPFSCSPHQ